MKKLSKAWCLKEIMTHFPFCAKIANPRLTLILLNCINLHMELLVTHIIAQLQRNLIWSFLETLIISLETPGFSIIEIFLMALLLSRSLREPEEIEAIYKDGKLKGQKPFLSEMLSTPSMKQIHPRCLSALHQKKDTSCSRRQVLHHYVTIISLSALKSSLLINNLMITVFFFLGQ